MKLVDADKITKNLTYDIANHPIHGNFKITVASVRAAISNEPAVDAVPVVRCKDCLYAREKYGHIECWHGVCYRNTYNEPDMFCSYGKRKDSDYEI